MVTANGGLPVSPDETWLGISMFRQAASGITWYRKRLSWLALLLPRALSGARSVTVVSLRLVSARMPSPRIVCRVSVTAAMAEGLLMILLACSSAADTHPDP